MEFTQEFLETLLEKGEVRNTKGETARLFTEIFEDNIEDQEHWKLIFSFQDQFFQVPYVMCGEIRFNENLAEVDHNDIYQYIDELYEKELKNEELINCHLLEDKTIQLTKEVVEELLRESIVTFSGETIRLTGVLYSEEDEEFETLTYKGDSFGFSYESLEKEESISCRTIPYIPSLTYGVCGC